MVICRCSNGFNQSPLGLLEELDEVDAVEATCRVAAIGPVQLVVRQVYLDIVTGVKQSGKSGIRDPEAVIERSRLDRMASCL